MKNTPTQVITRTGILLALMIVIQVFKNISPWITGPLVNAILVLGTLGAGIYSGVALSIIAPITALLIVQQPLMPLTGYTLIPIIALGNLIYVVAVWLATRKNNNVDAPLAIGLIAGSVIKWLVMWGLVAWISTPILLGNAAPEMASKLVPKLSFTYSTLQIGAALIGSVLAFLVWIPLKKALKK